jgi:hypothetical protein
MDAAASVRKRQLGPGAKRLVIALAFVAAPLAGGGPTSGRWQGQALGVCWEGSPRPIEASEVDALAGCGMNAISQTPFAWMEDPRAPGLAWSGERGWWGEREEGVRFLRRAARERGIATLLKPHVWLHGSWPGDVEMSSEEDWAAWFAAYREFVLQWARFAAAEGIEGLCVGTELDRTLAREAEWRALIRDVKSVYGGLLTYAANWTHFEQVPFWDELDAIGVNAYFPLSEAARPEVVELERAWQPLKARLAALAELYARPIVFTEVGYHPIERAFARPWEWAPAESARDPLAQANGYEALARVFYGEPWFGGVFWWKWHASNARTGARAERLTFSPQGLPAEDVLCRTFRAARAQ